MAGRRGRGSRALSLFVLAIVTAATRPTGTRAQDGPMRWDGAIEHLSTSQGGGWGQPSGDARLSRHPISRDGRYLVFTADVRNDPYPSTRQIFRRDRLTDDTQMVIGAQAPNPPVISADGNHLAFQTCESWWRPDGAAICDVYMVDFRYYSLVNASTTLDGTLSTDASDEPVLSGDGRFLVFRTSSPTLLPAGAAPGQLVLRDRDADGNGVYDEPGGVTMELVSVSTAGQAGDSTSGSAEMSADGRFVAFRSLASNLVPDDTNNAWDVFLRDRLTGETRRINVGWDGRQATSTLEAPAISISPDGALVAFSSDDASLTDLPTGRTDTNNSLDVLIYDRGSSVLTRLDPGVDGAQGNGHTYWPTFSDDGRYVSLLSTSTNMDAPVTPGRAHVYVYDRVTRRATRISGAPDGTEADRDSTDPVISGDGSFVTFLSTATNLFPGVTQGLVAVYGAGHFDATPTTLTIPGRGGSVTATVTAQQYVSWNAQMEYSWLNWETPPWGSGDGTIAFNATANPDPAPRSIPVTVGSKVIVVTQEPGLSMTGISPAEGPATGGTTVTITGTGLEPGSRVYFDGIETATEFVNSTTLRAVTPAHAPGAVFVWLRTPDFRSAWTQDQFRYLDTTPPVITPYVNGTLVSTGWYTSDVTIDWQIQEPDSSIVSSTGCAHVDVTTDTGGTTFTCTATSEGGTSSASTTVRRDTTPPTITIVTPAATIYNASPARTANYSCNETLSGIANCISSVSPGQPINMVPGFHTFGVSAIDAAGNTSYAEVPYAVSTGTCETRPAGLAAWWPFEKTSGGTTEASYQDIVSGIDAAQVNTQFRFGPGAVGAFAMSTANIPSYVNAGTRPALEMTGALTLSAWVFPTTDLDPSGGVIAGREGEYLLARFPDGTIRWSLATTAPGWGWVNTGYVVPRFNWSQVVLAYDGSTIATYVNGLLVHSTAGSGPIGDVAPSLDEFRIGARQDPATPSYFVGGIDDLQLLSRALTANEVRRIFLAGSTGLCGPRTMALTISPSPVHVAYGTTQSVELVARLTGAGAPVPGRALTLIKFGQPFTSGVTDASGELRATTTVTGTFVGTIATAFEADHAGDLYFAGAHTWAALLTDKAVPQITWPAPSPVAFGTGLGAEQLNAQANVAGTFTYSPTAGTVLAVGTHTLTAAFQPASPANYTTASATVTLEVTRAQPVIQAAGGTFTYDAAAHAANASATGIGGEPLAPVTITYNGAPDVPVNAGTYQVLASFAGNANYNAASATATLTIDKAIPTATAAGGTFTYDGAAHAASASATGIGGQPLAPVTITYNGAATVPINAGMYQVLASFAGNANYNAASASATLTIDKATPTATAAGGTFTYDGAAHAASASATGIGGEPLTPVTITYNGAPAVPVNAGTYQVVASFAGNGNYNPASATATLTIGRAAAVLQWSAPASIVYGTPIGAAQLNGTANTPGTFSYSPAAGTVLPAGPAQPLSATFTPADAANYTGGSVSTTLTVLRAPLTIRANDAAKPFGAPLPVLTASASGFVNGDSFASLTGTVGLATTATAQSAVGAYPIVPSGLGSPNYTVTFANGILAVVRGSVAVGVSAAPEPSGLNQPMTITATVAALAPASGAPGGVVRFFDGSTLLGTAAVAGGSATLTTAGLDPGTRAIQTSYDGDGSFDAGAGSTSHVIRDASGTPDLTVTSSRNPAAPGQNVTLTATVSLPSGSVAGAVQFYDGATLLGTGSIVAGRATFSTSALPSGSHAITALYTGGTGAPPARSGVFVQAVGPASWKNRSTTMTLSAAPTSPALGETVVFTASVTGSSGSMPTGRILIMVDGAVAGDPAGLVVAPVSGSTARVTLGVPGLAHGRHSVSATYLGDSNYKGSTAGLLQPVN